MIQYFSRIISQLSSHSSSFFAGFYVDYLSTSGSNLLNAIFDFLLRVAWIVVSFVMTVMDALEYVAYSFLGINFGINDFSTIAEKVNLDLLIDTFRAIAGLAVVLMIVFTIIAMVKQEWSNAAAGFSKSDSKGKSIETNPKTPFIKKILRNLVLILIMPTLVYIIFAGTTSILNSFNMALKQNQSSTIAGQVLASSTYEANKYRMYASQNQRLPIIINAYDASDANVDNIDDIAVMIESIEVQEKLRGVANNLVYSKYGSFNDSLVKKNNSIYNSSDYSSLYEQFICTAEQYYVMADFVDYAQQTGMTYYIKAIDDPNVEWKYVSSAVYDQSSNELTIKYTNSEVVNNGYQASAASLGSGDEYTIIYTPVTSATTPISDAIDSIMAMLGIGDYSDNLYNIMDRDDSFTNLVTWSNEKALLKLSEEFDETDKSTWTDSDEILIYEYYRWKYNNSLREYSIEDLKEGIEWDVKLISYQDYYDAVDLYSEVKYYYCVCLNKNYYIVHKSEDKFDAVGNRYYVLTEQDDSNFLNETYTIVTKTENNFTLSLSSDFSINSSDYWSIQDQIIVYEYFQDTTYQNKLRQFNFDEFIAGVSLPIYEVANYSSAGIISSSCECVILNNTLYIISSNTTIDTGSATSFLNKLNDGKTLFYYHYVLNDTNFNSSITARYGLPVDMSDLVDTISPSAFEDLLLDNVADKQYENYKLKLSSNFSYNDISTWSFRDIFVLYLYSQGYGYDVSYLKNYGLRAEVGKINNDYVLKIAEKDDGSEITYIKISDINKISTEGIYKINVDLTFDENEFSYLNQDVFLSFNSDYDKIIAENVETKTFEFSSGYNPDDDSSWTIEDFVLSYAINLGLIDEPIEIEEYQYDAKIYEEDGESYYKFGESRFVMMSKVPAALGSNISNLTGYADVAGKLFEKDDDDKYYAETLCSEWFSMKDIKDKSAVATYHFEFSKDFFETDDTTWTVKDFILVYASSLGLIGSIETIEYEGYNALIYNYAGSNYYRFGKNADNAYFLIESKIPTSYGSVERFLNSSITNLTGYSSAMAGNVLGNAETLCSDWFKDERIEEFRTSRGENVKINFSGKFEASNYNTWTQADFIVYYLCNLVYGDYNMQQYIDNGISAQYVNVVSSDVYGNAAIYKALWFEDDNIFINYNVLQQLYNRDLKNYQIFNTEAIDRFDIKLEKDESADIIIAVESSSGLAEFVFVDNYYYSAKELTAATETIKTYYDLLNKLSNISDKHKEIIELVDMTQISEISSINLKLQTYDTISLEYADFTADDLTDVSKWTVLDFIVLKEYGSDVKDNVFEGMTFEELCTLDNYYSLYIIGATGSENYYIEVNGNFYNLTDFIKPKTETITDPTTGAEVEKVLYYECNKKMQWLEYSTAGNYSFKIPYQELSFSVNPQIKYVIDQTEFTVAFSIGDNKTLYITPNDGTKIAFQKNLSLLDRYEVSDLLISVSWPKKLMNDMLVMYPELNWNTLLATGEWIDVLGDYVSAYTNGAFVTEGNSSNITAVGMVLSEFFLSVADKSYLGYADYEYSSLFDEDVIHSLMLSMLGEEKYTQLCLQADVFVEFFNNSFAKIIDDIAAEEAINIKDGTSINLSVFVYKAFLATQILSSDLGEYLYTIANRVYAQYTIYESLAQASDSYYEYEQYINGETQSLILKIGTEYYDITKFAEIIDENNRLEFNKGLEYEDESYDVKSLILNAEKKDSESYTDYYKRIKDYQSIMDTIADSYKILIKRTAGGNESTIVDRIIKNEQNNTSYQNEFKGKDDKLKHSGDGVEVDIYANSQYVLMEINGNYYDITNHVTNHGYYKIKELYSKYYENLNDSQKDNILEMLFNSGVFTPTAYAVTEAQEKIYGEHSMLVKYSGYRGSINFSNMTILDAIIDIYIQKFSSPYLDVSLGGGGIIFDWARWNFEGASDYKGNCISEKLYKDADYSLSCDVFVIENENAFTYATFEDLVLYENEQIHNTNATPMYTFNMKRVYELILKDVGKEVTNQSEWNDIWKKIINNESLNPEEKSKYVPDTLFSTILGWLGIEYGVANPWDLIYRLVVDEITGYYNKTYSVGKTILDDDPYYCYLYEVYYGIYYDCKERDENIPVYLKIYKEYLDGKINRWNILAKEDVSGSTVYIPYYEENKKERNKAQIKSILSFYKLFNYSYNYTDLDVDEIANSYNSNNDLLSAIDKILKEVDDANEVFSVKNVLDGSLPDSGSLRDDYENVFGLFTDDSILYDILSLISGWDELSVSLQITHLFINSGLGNRDCWISLVKLYNSLSTLIDETSKIMELFEKGDSTIAAARTENGSKIAEQGRASGIYYEYKTYEDVYNKMLDFYVILREYIQFQEIIDITVKSSITFALAQYGQNYVINYKFNVENRGYTMTSTSSPLRIAEYVLGGSFLVKFGVYPTYTSADFDGIIKASKVYDSVDGHLKTKLDMWPELREFAANIAANSAKLYYMTNFTDLSIENANGVYITDILSDGAGGTTTIEYMILEYLASANSTEDSLISAEILRTLILESSNLSITESENSKNDVLTLLGQLKTDYSNVHTTFKNIMSYLLLSEDQQISGNEEDIDFENLTLAGLKILIMQKLVDYESNPSELAEDNINRYLALLNLICCQIDYSYDSGAGRVALGTNLLPTQVTRDSGTAVIAYASASGDSITYKDTGKAVIGTFSVDQTTKNTLLQLANCDNIPVEDLVQMEYESVYKRAEGVYDENWGDIFVVCLFDEEIGKYVPFLAKNDDTSVLDSAYDEYLDKYHHLITTDYYAIDGRAYPIIAKGPITAGGLPTAIRIEDGRVKFYRTDITTTTDVNDTAVLNSITTSELTTIGYTDYVPLSFYLPFGDTNNMVKFIGDYNLGKVLSSDIAVYFLQTDLVYNLEPVDDSGGFAVLAELSAHYQLGMQSLFLMFLGFVVLIPLIFKLSLSAIRRIFDIIVLVLEFPLVAAMTSLKAEDDKKGPISTWTGQMTKAMLAVFGFVVGFNIYYLLVSTVLNLDFVNIQTFNNIKEIGGFSFISLMSLNQIIRYLFLIEAVALIKGAMSLLLPIITGDRASDAFASALDGKDVYGQMKSVIDDVKKAANKAVAIVNGEALIQMKDAAIETAKAMIPGSSIAGTIKENVQDHRAKKQAKTIKQSMEDHGVSSKVSSKFEKTYRENAKKQREQKRNMRLSSANAFMANYASEFGLNSNMFTPNRHILPDLKKKFSLPKREKKEKDNKKPKQAKKKK